MTIKYFKKLKKIIIHVNYLKIFTNTLYLFFFTLKYKFLHLNYWLCIINLINSIYMLHNKQINISFNLIMLNIDFRLIYRESSFLFSFLFKIQNKSYQNKTINSQKKKFSILRSPFIYSNSKETFSFQKCCIWFKLFNFLNVLLCSYILQIQQYYNKYNVSLFIKELK